MVHIAALLNINCLVVMLDTVVEKFVKKVVGCHI